MYHKLDKSELLELSPPISKTLTYLNYKKKEAYDELKKNLSLLNLDKVIFWSIILDLSYDYKNLIDYISLYICNDINIGNPKLIVSTWNLYQKVESMDSKFETFNYQEFRNHLNTLVSISCLSGKNQLPKLITFKKNEDINIHNFKHLIKRDNFKSIDNIISLDDKKIIFIPLNEIDYALSVSNDKNSLIMHCLHWLSYLFEVEKRENDTLCKSRKIDGISEKYNQHVVWLVWKIIFKNIYKKSNHNEIFPIVKALFNLHKTNYSKSNSNKRKVYLVYSILLIINKTPQINFNLPYIVEPDIVFRLNMKINIVYQNIYNLGKNMDKGDHGIKPNVKKKSSKTKNKTKIFIPLID